MSKGGGLRKGFNKGQARPSKGRSKGQSRAEQEQNKGLNNEDAVCRPRSKIKNQHYSPNH